MKHVIVTTGQAFADIDAVACVVAYTELLRLEGRTAEALLPGALNNSVTGSVRAWGLEYRTLSSTTDAEFVVMDVSDPKYFATAAVTKDRDGEPCWSAQGTTSVFETGRVNWWGRDPDWADKLGYRGQPDVESPGGEWTHIEVVCAGDTLDYFVNGKRVNQASQLSHKSGQLIFQSEGAEIYFRRIELHPLPTTK